MKPRISLREALSDPNLLGRSLAGDSWKAWRTLLIAARGEKLSDDERAIFAKLTGREREPLRPVSLAHSGAQKNLGCLPALAVSHSSIF
jgi:hypothetical protein